MDKIKLSVPIWKKEQYSNREPGWLPGESQREQADMFSRQVILEEIGLEGQALLEGASVLVIGFGGLGTPAVEYLLRAGIGHITIIDPDSVDATNLNRQICFEPRDIGTPKSAIAAFRYRNFPRTVITPIQSKIQESGLATIIANHDVILDCTDDIEAKYMLNDACVERCKTLVSASIHQWYGQVQIINGCPCIRCQLTAPPPSNCVGTCAEEGVIGTVAGIFGVLQANEAIKSILGIESYLNHHLLTMDLFENRWMKIKRKRNPTCPTCTPKLVSPLAENIEITLDELRDLHSVAIVDVRNDRTSTMPKEIAGHVVLDSLDSLTTESDRIVLICNSGRTSLQKAYQLRDQGKTTVVSLRGGVMGFSQDAN
ncbi:MAG: ThiF family adenylyltransferase [Fimbriimonadaceae bacterium]